MTATSRRSQSSAQKSGASRCWCLPAWGSAVARCGISATPTPLELSVGDVSATKIEASGSVYHLKKREDFDGNYTAVAAGATVAGGASAAMFEGVAVRRPTGSRNASRDSRTDAKSDAPAHRQRRRVRSGTLSTKARLQHRE